MVPRYRPGALSGVSVAPAIMGPMPGIVMLVERVALPASSGCPADVVSSSTNVLGPFFH